MDAFANLTNFSKSPILDAIKSAAKSVASSANTTVVAALANQLVRTLTGGRVDAFAYLAVEYVVHYLSGKQTNKFLPKAAILALREELVREIKHRLSVPSYRTCVASSPMTSVNVKVGSCTTWLGLMGVVGTYEFRVVGTTAKGLKVKCVDTWDFNASEYKLKMILKGGQENLLKPIFELASKFNLPVALEVNSINQSVVYIEEQQLAALNDKHCFKTTWTDVIPFDVLSESYKDIAEFNKPYLMTNSGKELLALISSVEALGGQFDGTASNNNGEAVFTYEGRTYDLNWKNINVLRKNQEIG